MAQPKPKRDEGYNILGMPLKPGERDSPSGKPRTQAKTTPRLGLPKPKSSWSVKTRPQTKAKVMVPGQVARFKPMKPGPAKAVGKARPKAKAKVVRSAPVKNQKKSNVRLEGAFDPRMKMPGVARHVPKTHPAGRKEWPGEGPGRHVTHTGVAIKRRKKAVIGKAVPNNKRVVRAGDGSKNGPLSNFGWIENKKGRVR